MRRIRLPFKIRLQWLLPIALIVSVAGGQDLPVKEKDSGNLESSIGINESERDKGTEFQMPAGDYEATLLKAMDKIFSLIESIQKEPDIGSKEKKEKALQLLRNIRYGPERKDYFWVNDLEGNMVMHPYKPDLEGKNLIDYQDPNGKRIFSEAVKVCREKGEGYLQYLWPKYEGETPVPKISLVRLFEPWNWVVGTGLYLDIIEAYIIEPTFFVPLPLPDPPEIPTSAY